VELTQAMTPPLSRGRVAWQEEIARHGHRVVVALVARRIPPQQARDLAQEAWTRLIEREDALGRIELPGLVIQQALFLARDEARSERRQQALPFDPVAAIEAGPEPRYLSAEALSRARGVIASLPARTRQIFERCCEHPELSHAEVAQQLDVSVQHVRQTLYEVRKRVREMLEEKS
jgi:RNA polymerase sigma factor (sigma-70 family)